MAALVLVRVLASVRMASRRAATGGCPYRVCHYRCPIFALYGSEEPLVGTAADLEKIRGNATSAPRVDMALIQGADHSYPDG